MAEAILWPSFCGNSSAFWDTQLTWNSTDPYFTECFQRTVLVWIPCAFLWIFLPIDIYCIKYSRGKLIPWTLLNITKLVLNTLLVVTALMDVGKILGSPERHGNNLFYDLFSPVFQLATFVLLVFLVYIERLKGVTSSGVLFFYWLFYCICGVFTLRNVLRPDYEQLSWSQRFDYFVFMAQFPVAVVQFLISGFNDARPLHAHVDDVDENACPRNTASFLYKLLFIWYDKLLWRGYRTQLQSKDVWKSTPECLAKNSYPEFTKHWKKAVDAGKKPSLSRVLTTMNFTAYISLTLIKTLEYVFAYSNPVLLKWLIEFVSNGEVVWHGYVYISGMLIAAIGASLCAWHSAYFGSVIQVSVQAALDCAIYRKSLVLANVGGSHKTVGEIVNLISVDIFNVTHFLFMLMDGITLPMQISVGIYMMYQLLGPATFAGLATMVILKLLSFFIAKQMEKLQTKQLELKDQRVKHVNEAILGVKVLKLFAWEKPVMRKINDIRLKETRILRIGMYLEGASMAMWTIAPAIVTLVTLITYVYLDEKNVLNASKIFVTLTIINILGSSFVRLPLVIVCFVQALVSVRRLNLFLNNKELDPDSVMHDEMSDDPLFIKSGFFSWDPEKILLKNINLTVKNKSLVAIVGPVGCGKSSLISALLGEMEKVGGTVNTTGTVAYVPQQPWIQNATLKSNILFGKVPHESYYSKVIQACALTPDLEILPGGDAIEIGENGINLSGGQKQRVSLARAVFNDADIYLLDDPLSAVDAHVGQHIFNHVIGSNGLLKNKTRVLVTHAVTYLPSVDQIVVLSKGTITEVGTYEELMAKGGDFADFITNYGTTNNSENDKRTRSNSTMSNTDADAKNDSSAIGSKLIAVENRERGNVSLSIYALYMKYIGYFLSGVIFLLMVIGYAFSAGVQNWLSAWSSDALLPDGSQDIPLRNLRMIVYGILTLMFGIFLVSGYNMLMYGARKAAIRFHHKMLSSVLRSPMSFFDTTPSGRIVNRFSEDIQSVDSQVPISFRDLFSALLEILTAILVICIRLPTLLLFVIPMAFIYFLFQRFFMRTINQLRRLESVSKSPLYSRFSETVNGVATIRAFRLQESFVERAEELIDEVVKFQFYVRMMFRWFGIRLDTMGGFLTFFTGLIVIIYRDTLSPGTVALVVSYSINVTYMFCWFVMNAGFLESNVVAVERIHEYISLTPEARWDIPDKKPDSSWPSKGSLSIQNLVTRYREELEPVLHNLTCHIGPGEKIGVVGRTGAGKSSITMSLFRIIEAMKGSIIIDGVDISTIGLHDLRSSLTIIPQDPVLFSGTLRYNLDPFDRYTDDELWRALEHSHLKEYVSSLSCGLLHLVSEGGSNLSVGQKQLVCLARALLRKSKILVLDEATAAVDLETDDLIQTTIRTEFADSTVLTIAHRINTIMDSTKVMVLDKGTVKEFDTPENLLSDTGSVFYSMAKQSGL